MKLYYASNRSTINMCFNNRFFIVNVGHGYVQIHNKSLTKDLTPEKLYGNPRYLNEDNRLFVLSGSGVEVNRYGYPTSISEQDKV